MLAVPFLNEDITVTSRTLSQPKQRLDSPGVTKLSGPNLGVSPCACVCRSLLCPSL